MQARLKSRLDNNGTHTDPALEQGEAVDDEHATKQPSKQDGLDKQPIPGENNSPDDLTPDKPSEHKNLHKRLVATARSLKKQKRMLKTAEDALRMRWSKVVNTADKYGNSHQAKSYPKRKLLPEFDEEAVEPPQSKNKGAARSDRRPHGKQRAAKHTSRHVIHIRILAKRMARSGPSMGQERRLQKATQHVECLKITVHPNTGAPHAPYVSPMRCWIMNFQRDSSP